MKIFKKLRRLRAIQSRYLSSLETLEDVDIVRAIGFFQETGHPLTFKLLSLENIASPATIQRRLGRLKRLGVVVQKPSKHDKRSFELAVSPEIRKIYQRKASLLRRG